MVNTGCGIEMKLICRIFFFSKRDGKIEKWFFSSIDAYACHFLQTNNQFDVGCAGVIWPRLTSADPLRNSIKKISVLRFFVQNLCSILHLFCDVIERSIALWERNTLMISFQYIFYIEVIMVFCCLQLFLLVKLKCRWSGFLYSISCSYEVFLKYSLLWCYR